MLIQQAEEEQQREEEELEAAGSPSPAKRPRLDEQSDKRQHRYAGVLVALSRCSHHRASIPEDLTALEFVSVDQIRLSKGMSSWELQQLLQEKLMCNPVAAPGTN